MTEINEVKKEEILIKQNRLKTLIDIEKLTSISSDSTGRINKTNILNYAAAEKHEIVLDILNDINITEFDSVYVDMDNSLTTITIESDIDYVYNKSKPVPAELYSEFVSVLASYNIEDLINLDIISNYLKMLKTVTGCYDELCLSECKKL